MKNVYSLAFLCILFFSACRQQAGKGQEQGLAVDTLAVAEVAEHFVEPDLVAGSVTLTEEDFGPLIELSGRQQLFDENGPIFKISEPEVLMVNGCFLFQNRPSGGRVTVGPDGKPVREKSEEASMNHFFHWYRLPDFRYMTSMGLLGNGPDEFMFPHLVEGCGSARGTAYLYESTTYKLYAADTTGVLKPVPVRLDAIKGSGFSDKQIAVAAPDTFYVVDNVRGGKALFRTTLQGDSTVTEQIYNLSFSKRHKGWAAYIGDFLMSPSGNRMVYAYKYFHRLLVMDKEASVVREISFSGAGVDAKDDRKTLGPDNVTHYWGASATEHHFFLVYSGRTPLKVGQETDKGDSYIFVEQYDWGGNPVARYKLDHWGKVFTDGTQFYQLFYKYDDPLFIYTLPTRN